MKELLLVSLAALCACSGSPGTDGGSGGGAGGGGVSSFNVSGHAVVYPVAAALDGGAISLIGLTARVEEPFKVATNVGGVFSSAVLDSTLSFDAGNLSPDDIVFGVGAGIFEDGGTLDGGARVIRSATTIYDVALHDGDKPTADITGAKGYAIPVAFHNQLVTAITVAKIQQLTMTNGPYSTLVEGGCMIGRVIDAQGNPVAGVTVHPTSHASSFFYPTADLSTTGAATSSNGVFIYVHNGDPVVPFNFTIDGHSEYKQRTAGAAPGACLVLDVFPGTTPP